MIAISCGVYSDTNCVVVSTEGLFLVGWVVCFVWSGSFFFFFLFFFSFFFFFNDTATTEIYTLSLHDALPICPILAVWLRPTTYNKQHANQIHAACYKVVGLSPSYSQYFFLFLCFIWEDRKSTRLNSSHRCISYAVFCLKKKKKSQEIETI